MRSRLRIASDSAMGNASTAWLSSQTFQASLAASRKAILSSGRTAPCALRWPEKLQLHANQWASSIQASGEVAIQSEKANPILMTTASKGCCLSRSARFAITRNGCSLPCWSCFIISSSPFSQATISDSFNATRRRSRRASTIEGRLFGQCFNVNFSLSFQATTFISLFSGLSYLSPAVPARRMSSGTGEPGAGPAPLTSLILRDGAAC